MPAHVITAHISATFKIWRLINFLVSLRYLSLQAAAGASGCCRGDFRLLAVGQQSFAARIHLIIWVADVEPDGRCLGCGRRVSRAAQPRERKVRTPQSSVPDNVREGGFKAALRKVPQKIYRLGRKPRVRVKRCGKSAPLAQ